MRGLSTAWGIGLIVLAGCGGARGATETTPAGDDATVAPSAARYDATQPSGEHADQLRGAIGLIDQRRFDEAIATLEALRRSLPHNGFVLHELALAHRLAGHPERAVEVLAPYEDALGVQATAGLGSAVHEAGDAARAETILRRGIRRHPHAGLLYSELAVVVGSEGRMDEAVSLFLQGMEAEPAWPTNYLHAANVFARSRAAGLTIYWGEMFRLLEPNSPRSQQMAGTIVGALQQNVEVGAPDAQGDRSISVRLAPGQATVSMQPGGLLTMPFTHALELGEGSTLATAMLPGLSLASLHAARRAFFESRTPYPETELFSWLAALAAAGHLEAYDVWLFGPAFPQEAEAWKAAHADRMTALQRYIDAHPFRPATFIAPNAPTSMPAPAAGDGG